jgi:putative spermidine/putrescine transport system ATP-binding protein
MINLHRRQAMSFLSLNNLKVAYGDNVVLENFNLEIEKGEFVSLLGPSGCGKTTTLRSIAGFVTPQSGKIMFKNRDYTDIPVHKKHFGFVFQSYALFPHLNVFDNVAFGLKMQKTDKKEIKSRVNKILDLVGLSGFQNRYPKELSGGQQQRVALSRALVIEPDLLLLDEPLSNLDAKLRVEMRVEIRNLQQELGLTTVYVTHDQEECFSISDRVVVMEDGKIVQFDTPEVIYRSPETEFVADFVGFENYLDLYKEEEHFKTDKGVIFEVDTKLPDIEGNHYRAAVRPDDLIIKESGGDEKKNLITGKIKISTFLGKEYQYLVDTVYGEFIVNAATEQRIARGSEIYLYFPPDKIIIVKEDSY